MPAHRHAELDAAHRQRRTGHREIVNRHPIALRFELTQKRREAAARQGRFKGKVLFGGRQLFQAHQHDAAGLHRNCIGMAPRQSPGNVVCVHKDLHAQRRQDRIRML